MSPIFKMNLANRSLSRIAFLGIAFTLFFSSCSKVAESKDEGDINTTEAVIKGKLLGTDGLPIEGAFIYIDADSSGTALSGKDGVFKLSITEVGSALQLKIYHRDWALKNPNLNVSLVLGQELTLPDSVLTMQWNYRIIKGRIQKKSTTQSIQGAGVSIAKSTLATLTGQDGEFLLDKIPADKEEIVLLAGSNNIGSLAKKITLNKISDTLDLGSLSIEQGGILVKGVVYETASKPFSSGAVVKALGSGLTDTTDELGNYTLQDVPVNQEGLIIEVEELKGAGLTGSVMGINASSAVMGVNIFLKKIPTSQNGIELTSVDQIIAGGTEQNITLEVFPKIKDVKIFIKKYYWKLQSGSLLGTSTEPRIQIPRSSLKLAKISAEGNLRYTVLVSAENNLGQISEEVSFEVQVHNDAPVVSQFGLLDNQGNLESKSEYTVVQNNLVQFKGVATDPIGGLSKIIWDFGDLDTLVLDTLQPVVAHLYEKAGEYWVKVTFIDNQGKKVADSIKVNVLTNNLPKPNLSPYSGYEATTDSQKVNLSWSWIENTGVRYNVYRDTRNNPPRILWMSNTTKTDTSFVPEKGKTYYWYVEVIKEGSSITSQVQTIKGWQGINFIDILVSPKAGEEIKNLYTQLKWKYQKNAQYKVLRGTQLDKLSTLSDFTTYYSSNLDTTYYFNDNNLKGHTQYFWRVIEKQESGEEKFSLIRNFYTPNQKPSIPGTSSPADGSVVNNGKISFTWNTSTDADQDSLKYIIFLDENDPPTTPLASVYTVGKFDTTLNFKTSNPHQWRVAAFDGFDTVYSTRIHSLIPNNPPEIITEIKDLRDSFVLGETYTDTLQAIDLEKDVLRYGKVNSKFEDLATDYFTEGKFTFTPKFVGDSVLSLYVEDKKGGRDTISWNIYVAAPTSNVLIQPLTGDSVAGGSVQLRWKYNSSLDYKLLLGTDSTKLDTQTTAYFNAYGTQYHYTTLQLSGHREYYWKLVLINKTQTTTSPLARFYAKNQKPGNIYYGNAPYNVSILPNQNIRFEWTKVTDADSDTLKYLIYLDSGTAKFTKPLATVKDTSAYNHTQGIARPGTYNWAIAVTDGIDTVLNQGYHRTFYINSPPTFTSTSLTMKSTARVGEVWRDTLRAVDPDKHELSYYFLKTPPEQNNDLNFKFGNTYFSYNNSTDSTLSWTPRFEDVGTHTISIRVTDYRGQELVNNDTLTWTITVEPPNGSWQLVGDRALSGASTESHQIRYNGSVGTVAYIEGTSGVRVRRNTDDNNWLPYLSNSPTLANTRNNVSLELTSTGEPVVVYQSYNSPYSIYCLKSNGSSWDTVGKAPVGLNPFYTGNNSLALINDTAFVAFRSSVSPFPGVVYKDSAGSWVLVGRTDVASGTFSNNGGVKEALIKSSGNELYVAYINSTDQLIIKKFDRSTRSWITPPGTSPFSNVTHFSWDSKGTSVLTLAYQTVATGISVTQYNGTTWSSLGATGIAPNAKELVALKVNPSVGDVVLVYINSFKDVSALRYAENTWSVLGYPSFTQSPNYEETHIDMDMRSGIPYVIYKDTENNPQGSSVMKFIPKP